MYKSTLRKHTVKSSTSRLWEDLIFFPEMNSYSSNNRTNGLLREHPEFLYEDLLVSYVAYVRIPSNLQWVDLMVFYEKMYWLSMGRHGDPLKERQWGFQKKANLGRHFFIIFFSSFSVDPTLSNGLIKVRDHWEVIMYARLSSAGFQMSLSKKKAFFHEFMSL